MDRRRLGSRLVPCLFLATMAACGGSGGDAAGTGPVIADWHVQTPNLGFGLVPVGESQDLTAAIYNGRSQSASLTQADLASGSFTLPFAAFPIQVGAGQTAYLTVRFAPTATGSQAAGLSLSTDVGTSPLNVSLSGTGTLVAEGSEQITDYGTVPLSGLPRETGLLSVQVPSDAISLTIEAVMDSDDVIEMVDLIGPGSKVYENSLGTGNYVWSPGFGVFVAQLPNTDRSDVQMVPGGGIYSFRLGSVYGGTSMRVRAIVERRSNGFEASVLDLNVWLANGIPPKAATAPGDLRLQQVLARIDAVLGQQGIRLGDVDYYDVTDERYDRVNEWEFRDMLRLTSAAAEVRMNLFFVVEALGGGIVGVSPLVGGPKANGTEASGVMSVYEGYSTSTIGLIAGHELGHYLGLFHTVEETGEHDFIDDTPECQPYGTSEACPSEGGGLIMHWQAVGGDDVTDGQGLVIRGHPHMEPDPLGATKATIGPGPAPMGLLELSEVMSLPANWCGTCATARKQGGR